MNDGVDALKEAFGLNDAGIGLLGEAFAVVGEAAAFDGRRVFDALKEGQSLGAALSLPPAAIEAVYAHAYHWLALGQLDKAAPLFRALTSMTPQRADYWIGFGACVRRMDAATARAAFQTAARLRPGWGLPHVHLLSLAMRRGEWAAAEAALSAYRATGDKELPPEIIQEAARLADALAARRGTPAQRALI